MAGIDGNEYPIPTREQVTRLFIRNKELVNEKVPQGFIHLALTPMATPVSFLIERMGAAILKHAAEDSTKKIN